MKQKFLFRCRLGLFLVLLCASTVTLAAARVQDGGATEPREGAVTVFLVRHAEKAKDDRRDPSLTEEGRARAATLARLVGEAGVSHLYSTDYRRTRATLGPLAVASEVEVQLYDPRKPDDLVARVAQLPAGSVVMVAGHSNTTPGLFRLLSGRAGRALVDSMIPDDEYDRLYCVTLARDGEGEVSPAASFELRYGE
jgi:phosphohistidine phosphatase SixA